MDLGDPYSGERKAPDGFLRRLKDFDPLLTCAWNKRRNIFQIIRKRPQRIRDELEPFMAKVRDEISHESVEVREALAPVVNGNVAYSVAMDCAVTVRTMVLDDDGRPVEMIIPREPGDWVFPELVRKDTWRTGYQGYIDDMRAHNEAKREEGMRAILPRQREAQEKLNRALRKDFGLAEPRVPILVAGTKGW